MAITLLIVFLALFGAYYLLGAPIMEYIHRFVKEFVHSFPLAAFFAAPRGVGTPRARGTPAVGRQRRRRPSGRV